MSNVKVTALKAFAYKGEYFEEGDEVSVSAKYAATLDKLNYIKLDKSTSEKVEKVVTKEKKEGAGPNVK